MAEFDRAEGSPVQDRENSLRDRWTHQGEFGDAGRGRLNIPLAIICFIAFALCLAAVTGGLWAFVQWGCP
jgi:hypothetical protein